MIPHSKPWITDKDLKAVSSVLRGGRIDQNHRVRLFEKACAQYLGVPDAVAVGSGTAALTLALCALELKTRKEVVLPTYVCRNVMEAILTAGYLPVLCDVGESWTISHREGGSSYNTENGGDYRGPSIWDPCGSGGV